MKKSVTIFLIIAIVNCYLGCTSTIMVPAANNKLDTTNNDKSLEIVTHDSMHYFFEENSYTFKNDTIIGKGIINNEGQQIWVKISFIEILEIYEGQEQTSAEKTFGLVILGIPTVLFVGGMIWFMIALSN